MLHMTKRKVKTIYRFHKLVFDRETTALNVSTKRLVTLYGLWQQVLVRYHTRESDYVWVVAAGSSQISYEGKRPDMGCGSRF